MGELRSLHRLSQYSQLVNIKDARRSRLRHSLGLPMGKEI